MQAFFAATCLVAVLFLASCKLPSSSEKATVENSTLTNGALHGCAEVQALGRASRLPDVDCQRLDLRIEHGKAIYDFPKALHSEPFVLVQSVPRPDVRIVRTVTTVRRIILEAVDMEGHFLPDQAGRASVLIVSLP